MKQRPKLLLGLAGAWTLMGVSQAQSLPRSDARTVMEAPQAELSLYGGESVDGRLLAIPKQIVTGDLRWTHAHIVALGYAHPVTKPGWLHQGLHALGIQDASTAVEVIGARHHGRQRNSELSVAYLVRTGYAGMGAVRVRAAVGMGLSHAFGRPDAESGTWHNPEKRYRTLVYNAYELEGSLVRWPDTAMVLRIHHRSGMYGVVAPSGVGSNYLTLGIRQRF